MRVYTLGDAENGRAVGLPRSSLLRREEIVFACFHAMEGLLSFSRDEKSLCGFEERAMREYHGSYII